MLCQIYNKFIGKRQLFVKEKYRKNTAGRYTQPALNYFINVTSETQF